MRRSCSTRTHARRTEDAAPSDAHRELHAAWDAVRERVLRGHPEIESAVWAYARFARRLRVPPERMLVELWRCLEASALGLAGEARLATLRRALDGYYGA
jgi:hypothetical protein